MGQWLREKPEEVFVVHGEDAVCEAFTSCLKDEYKFKARAPYSGDVFDLIAGEWTEWGSKRTHQKKQNRAVLISDFLQPANV